ncbi:MAG: hypothetical protein ACD_47C00471G0003 [uncultured bacterium]|nr:MAG: hypothetical protein ACD_47C00471G0003 [uncultured bacterium]HBC74246.1 hypothetical protein [Candidatus Wallbacteria bacterium]
MEIIEELYDRYYEQLRRFALRITRDANQAEELAQETFARAASNVELLNILSEYKRRSWLFSVLKNYNTDLARGKKFEEIFDENLELESACGDPDAKLDAMEMLSKLPPGLRDIVFKRYWLDMTSAEIAGTLTIPDSTVRYHLRTAINFLRRKNKINVEDNLYDEA